MTPDPGPGYRCLRCRAPLRAYNEFCASCGADNRARMPDGDGRSRWYGTPWPILGAAVVTAYVLGSYWPPLPGHEVMAELWQRNETGRVDGPYGHHTNFPYWAMPTTFVFSAWFFALRATIRKSGDDTDED